MNEFLATNPDFITVTGDFAEMTATESEAFWTMYPIGFAVGLFAFSLSAFASMAFKIVKTG